MGFLTGERETEFETRKVNRATISYFHYSHFIRSSFCKDVLGTIFHIKYVSIMDYRTSYAAYCLEKREEFSKIQIKDWGFLIGSGFF